MFKWFKRNKKAIVCGIQLGLFLHFTTVGFWATYLLIAYNLNVPIEWSSIIATMLVALASTLGLSVWLGHVKEVT